MKASSGAYLVPASPISKAKSQISSSLATRYTWRNANCFVLLEVEDSRASGDETEPSGRSQVTGDHNAACRVSHLS